MQELRTFKEAERLVLQITLEQMAEDLATLLGPNELTDNRRMQLLGQVAAAHQIGRKIAGEKYQLEVVLAELLDESQSLGEAS